MLGVGQTTCHGSSHRCLHTMLPWHGTLRGICGGEVKLHRGLDCRGEMARMLDCMFEGVALGIQWSKGRADHLELAFALAFVSGSSERARL